MLKKGDQVSELATWLRFILEIFRSFLKYLEKRKIRRNNGGSTS